MTDIITCLGSNRVAETHLWLNQYHSDSLDRFLSAYTHLGEWLPWTIAAILLFYGLYVTFLKGQKDAWRLASLPLLAQVYATIIVQPIKHLINEPRPLTFFTDHYPDIVLPLVEGVRMRAWHSFPSGHTASFFALALSLIYLIRLATRKSYPAINTVLILFAMLGGYSRIYLSQHFLHDVVIGMVIGLISAYFAKLTLQKHRK